MAATTRTPRRVLVIDVGGTHVKFRVSARGTELKFVSGPKLTPAAMLHNLKRLAPHLAYDAVSIGYPGIVFRDRITAEPHNLGKGWVGFDFARALGKPVRIVNDAAMQAIGSYEGGRMLFLGLGTGLGSAMIVDGIVAPMELAHLTFKKGRSYEEYVGERGLRRFGEKKWRRKVNEVVEQLSTVLEVDYVVIGGGNARKLKRLPKNARLGSNDFAFIGGFRVWRGAADPPAAAKRTGRRINIP